MVLRLADIDKQPIFLRVSMNKLTIASQQGVNGKHCLVSSSPWCQSEMVLFSMVGLGVDHERSE